MRLKKFICVVLLSSAFLVPTHLQAMEEDFEDLTHSKGIKWSANVVRANEPSEYQTAINRLNEDPSLYTLALGVHSRADAEGLGTALGTLTNSRQIKRLHLSWGLAASDDGLNLFDQYLKKPFSQFDILDLAISLGKSYHGDVMIAPQLIALYPNLLRFNAYNTHLVNEEAVPILTALLLHAKKLRALALDNNGMSYPSSPLINTLICNCPDLAVVNVNFNNMRGAKQEGIPDGRDMIHEFLWQIGRLQVCNMATPSTIPNAWLQSHGKYLEGIFIFAPASDRDYMIPKGKIPEVGKLPSLEERYGPWLQVDGQVIIDGAKPKDLHELVDFSQYR